MTIDTKHDYVSYSGDDERTTAVERKMEQFNYQEDGLIEVLLSAQDVYGFLPKELLSDIAKRMHIPFSRVYSVATFYDLFELDSPAATECKMCIGPACTIAGSKDVLEEVRNQAGVPGLDHTSAGGQYKIEAVPCLGLCDQAPVALVNKKAQVDISLNDVPALLRGDGSPARINICGEPRELTAFIGVLEPTDLDSHRSNGAFTALEKALSDMTPEEVIEEVKQSRLTGRGGAGFSTGLKWEFARKATGEPKYVVCNFDESEPGTFKDRVLMEGDPFRVIEGLAISAYAIGAEKGYIFVRGEYTKASDIIQEAIEVMHTTGLLGTDIMNTGFNFEIEVRHNAGAYICGEETALFEAIEGKRGYPRLKPPYPTQIGLFGKPTAINNVETLAVVPSLIVNGGNWFRQWGTEDSVGLKLFCLSGHVNQPGVVEVPYGLTVRELIEGYGGGFAGEPQAILIGGAAGGFLNPENLDTPLTHEDLQEFDAPIGSGAVMVFNQSVDLWQAVESITHFFVHEGCGQCAPCRIGTKKIYNFLQKVNDGEGVSTEFQKMTDLGTTIKNTCVCGLGMTAANPFVTYMKNFEETL